MMAHQFALSRPEDVLFAFLEAYLDRMEGAIAVQVWSTCLTFVRDFLSNISTSRPYIFSCLRCVLAGLDLARRSTDALPPTLAAASPRSPRRYLRRVRSRIVGCDVICRRPLFASPTRRFSSRGGRSSREDGYGGRRPRRSMVRQTLEEALRALTESLWCLQATPIASCRARRRSPRRRTRSE